MMARCYVWKLLTVLGAISVAIEPGSSKGLNNFIQHYEPLNYDSDSLMWHHNRVRRSVVGTPHLELQFEAFNRMFQLTLEPEKDLFHPNFSLMVDGRKVDQHDTKAHMYSGCEAGDPHSHAHGNLVHGVFDGTVVTDGVIYHIEPANRYSEHLSPDKKFHSIIYRQSDLNDSTLRVATCGSSDNSIHKSTLKFQNSAHPSENKQEHILKKRQAGRDRNKVRCWLNVTIDYKLYMDYQSIGQDPKATVLNIIMVASTIFRSTDFDSDGSPDNIHFGVQAMTVESMPPPPGSFFANNFIGVSAFLNQHSVFDYSDFCLAYRFTYRDFDDGVVGLAYIAPQEAGSSAGGICENIRTFSGGVRQTLNTGIVSALNYGNRIPSSLTALTFAHEAGHNFGSQHDEGDPPSNGAYIMHAFATSGSQPNNDEFSPASRSMMNTVIADRGQGPEGCFVEGDNLCGNSLVDEGEDCDCGPASRLDSNGICMDDKCCLGSNCTLKTDVLCSPDQGPCCNSSCMFVLPSENLMCSMDTDCAFNQTCGGSSFTCPDPTPRMVPADPGYILCNMDQAVCNGAECNGTICVALDLPDCECSSFEESCHVCCDLNGTCLSTLVIAEQNISGLRSRLPGEMGRNIQVGRPCANFTGYCDFLNNCSIVDENGAIFRLANLFFNSELFRRTLDFISRMWWVILIAAVVLLIVMFVVVVLFHVLLPRSEIVQSHPRRMSVNYRKRRQQQRNHPSSQQQAPPGDYPQNYPQYYH